MTEEDAGRDVGAVGIADSYHFLESKLIANGRTPHKLRQFIGPRLQILQVENAFRQPPEEAGVAVLQCLAARAEQSRCRIELAPERDELVLISTGSVEQEQCSLRRAADVLMDEIQLSRHW
jgi:hypothetical protein